MTNDITKTIYLKTNAEDLWSYLTEPDKLAIWFHRPSIALSEQGKSYEVISPKTGKVFMSGKIIEAKPYSKLSYEFYIPPMGDQTSLVTWKIEDIDGGVKLTLNHSGLPQGVTSFDLLTNLDAGWDAHIARMRADIHTI